ncbi:MAG: hypothetical protein H0V66_15180 [Bdellovibrionales bacterium]|nr:hypothetical protein [Bdellovibrionales bacterium]
MKMLSFSILLLLSVPAFSQGDSNTKTIIRDNGDTSRDNIDSKKLCGEVRDEQQRLLKMIRPEFKGTVSLKESVPLEVFRADSSFGYAVKCVLQFPSK